MKAIFYGIAVVGGLVAYEAIQGLKTAKAAAPSSQPAQPGSVLIPPSASGNIPGDWLTALANHESPSALRGDFSYGAFGLSCGAGQGLATGGCTPPLPSKDPTQAWTPPLDIFANWDQAVAGLNAWINRNAPEALGATSCAQFTSILQSHGYGPLAGTC